MHCVTVDGVYLAYYVLQSPCLSNTRVKYTAGTLSARCTMLQNYLTIAIRNLLRYPAYTLINIVGLAIGLAACMLILRYVWDELSYDRYHPHAIGFTGSSMTLKSGRDRTT